MPSQQQLKWSQLRVGITVVVALITLAVLIFLMSGTAGLFTTKLTLYAYFDNAEGLLVGAPVAQLDLLRKLRVIPAVVPESDVFRDFEALKEALPDRLAALQPGSKPQLALA